MRFLLGAVACALALGAQEVSAFAQRTDEAKARALFGEGRALVEAGQYAVACPRFEAASRLFASAGLLVNLGDCYERIGRMASASAAFAQSALVASRTDRPDEAAEAKRRQAALDARLARLSIRVAHPVSGLTVTRDGVDVPASAWGTSMAVDLGAHEIRAQAPGYSPFTQSVAVSDEGRTTTAEIPELHPIPSPAPPVTPAAPVSVAPTAAWSAPTTTPLPLRPGPPATAARPSSLPDDCRSDGNPRHELGWIDATLGAGYSTMASLNTNAFAVESTSGGGLVIGVGAGVRLSFLTLGGRVRALVLENLSMWELDLESAFHVQVDATEVYLGLRGGYAVGSIPGVGNSSGDTSVDGFNIGTMLGFNSYLTRALSWGLECNPELLDVQRPTLPLPAGLTLSMLTPNQQALYQASGLNIGLFLAVTAHVGVHF